MLQRRQIIALLGGVAVAPALSPLAAGAQDRVRRIGALSSLAENDPEGQTRIEAFQQGLQKLGWRIGGNVRIDYRWAGGSIERMRAYAAELVASKPDVILAAATTAMVALKEATSTLPIVFAQRSQ